MRDQVILDILKKRVEQEIAFRYASHRPESLASYVHLIESEVKAFNDSYDENINGHQEILLDHVRAISSLSISCLERYTPSSMPQQP